MSTEVSTSYKIIERVRKAISTSYVTASDSQVSKAMGISRASVSAYKVGREVMTHDTLSRANELMKLSNYELGELGWQLLLDRARSDEERSVYAAMRSMGRAVVRSILLAGLVGVGLSALPAQRVSAAESGAAPSNTYYGKSGRKLQRWLKTMVDLPLRCATWTGARIRSTAFPCRCSVLSPART